MIDERRMPAIDGPIGVPPDATDTSAEGHVPLSLWQALNLAGLVVLWLVASIGAAWQMFGNGRDYSRYALFYDNLSVNWITQESRFEPGFKLWAQVCQNVLHLNFEMFMLSVIATALGIKFWLFYKKTELPIVAAVIYLLMLYPLQEYTQVRAALGVAFALLSTFYFIEKRFYTAVAVFAIATTMHYSMIAAPLFVFAAPYVRGRATLLAGIVLVVAINALLPNARDFLTSAFSSLNPLTERYVYNTQQDESVNILSIINVALSAIVLYFIALGGFLESRSDKVFLVMGIVAIMVTLVFRDSIELALRLRDVFTPGLIFLVCRSPNIVARLPALGLLFVAASYVFFYNHVGETIFL